MTALEAVGERAEALQHARLHGTLLHQELDAAPEAAVVELAERLRGESDGGPVRRWYSRRGGRRSSDGVAPEHAAVHDPAAPRSPRRGAGVTAAKLALGAALLTGIGAALVARPDRHVRLDPDLVAVAPFDVLPPQLALWREGLMDLFSRGLDRAGPLRAVTPTLVTREWRGRADPASAAELGRRTGAGLVLYGALLGAGPDSVQLTATLVDAASGRTLAELAYRDVVDRVDRMSDSVIVAVPRELRRTRPIVATAAGRRHRLTTSVLGPDGSASICSLLPQGAQVPVRLFNSTPPPLLGGYGTLACPESRLHLSVPAGSWYLGVELPPAPGLGALPWRYLATSPVAIGGGDASHDIVIEEGSRLGGRATFEGKPVEGVGLTVSYESQGMMAAYGGSGKDGRWVEFFGRSPVVLQKGVRYTLRPFACEFLGAKLVNKPPTGGFLVWEEEPASGRLVHELGAEELARERSQRVPHALLEHDRRTAEELHPATVLPAAAVGRHHALRLVAHRQADALHGLPFERGAATQPGAFLYHDVVGRIAATDRHGAGREIAPRQRTEPRRRRQLDPEVPTAGRGRQVEPGFRAGQRAVAPEQRRRGGIEEAHRHLGSLRQEAADGRAAVRAEHASGEPMAAAGRRRHDRAGAAQLARHGGDHRVAHAIDAVGDIAVRKLRERAAGRGVDERRRELHGIRPRSEQRAVQHEARTRTAAQLGGRGGIGAAAPLAGDQRGRDGARPGPGRARRPPPAPRA